jgi:hypothetical protein
MGKCADCVHFDTSYETKHFLGATTYGCTLLKIYVTRDGSCNSFQEKPKYNPGSGSSGCFLTSACVEYQGKADDCEELTALRKFRDEYMKPTENGQKLVKEYYEVAPEIVKNINASDKKDTYYKYIAEVVDKCVRLIKAEENERVLNEYKFMVQNLKKEFEL